VEHDSGVGVLDKAVRVLDALEAGPAALAELVARTGLPRATAHRLAVALEVHALVARDAEGRFLLGPRVAVSNPLVTAAGPVLESLRDETGESAALFVRTAADSRRCLASADRASGLRDTVPVGAVLPMTAGSAAHVFLAETGEPLPAGAAFGARELAAVIRYGYGASVEEREPGLASVSAPVRNALGATIAAISVSGPVERLTRNPGKRFGPAVIAAARKLEQSLASTSQIQS
jgi:DNA-binding IclR family transcriptional regulator